MTRGAASWRKAILAAVLLLSPGALALVPPVTAPASALAPSATVDAIAILEATLPALRRPYYAQLPGAPLDGWPRDYAWQLAALMNPVIDPGFALGGLGWTLEGAAPSEGALAIEAGGRAIHDFRYAGFGPGETPCSDEGCGGASLAHTFAMVSFVATGEGLVDVALREPNRGSAYATTPVAFHAGVNRVRLDDFDPQRPPPIRGIPSAPPERALLASLLFTSEQGATIDDVFVQARAGTPAGPLRGVDPRSGPDVDGDTLLDAAFGPLARAHDGVSALVFPMAAPPSQPTFYALAIEHGPSGARVLAIDPDLSILSSAFSVGGVGVPVEASATPLATAASPFARLLAEAGLAGEGVVLRTDAASNAWEVSLVASEDSVQVAAGAIVRGALHLGKIADPGSPVADVLDLVPDAAAALAGPTLFHDLDGDGYTDAVEAASGSQARDARDMPGRNPTLVGEIAAGQVRPRIRQIIYPLATMTESLAPGVPLVAELDAVSVRAPGTVTARLVPSFEPTGDIVLDAEVLDERPRSSERWPGRVPRVWRVALSLPEDAVLPAGAFGALYKLEMAWAGGSDEQPRAVQLIESFPERPLVAVISDARLGDPVSAGNASLARAFEELSLLRPDVVLFTGDVVVNAEGYALAHQMLESLRAPVLFAPGDRDAVVPGVDGREAWRAVFGPLHHATPYGPDVTFVALDTFDRPASERFTSAGGSVGDTQLAWLRPTLEAAEGDTIIAFGHHSPSWPQASPTLRDVAVSPSDPAGFLRTLVAAFGAYLPHPVDLVVAPVAAAGEVERWTGPNRVALQEALRDANVAVFFAGHLLEDRVARVANGEVLAVGAGASDAELGAFLATSVDPLYVDVTGIGADGREYRGFRLWDGSGLGLDGYDITAASLASKASQPGLWREALREAKLYSVPVGGLEASMLAGSPRIATLEATNALDEAVTLHRSLTFADDPDAILAGRDVAIARVSSAAGSRFADVVTTVPARANATRTIYLDDAAPVTRLLPVAETIRSSTMLTLVIDPTSGDELEGALEGIFIERCAAATCETIATSAAPGDTIQTILPGEGTFAFHARGRDVAGHVEARGDAEVTVVLDATPPESLVERHGTVGAGGWYVGDVTVTVTCDARGGAACTPRARVNGGAWSTVAAPLVFDAAVDALEVSAIDAAGNEEAPWTVAFRIDQEPPTTTIALPPAPSGWHTAPMALGPLVGCVDDASGCATTSVQVAGGPWRRPSDVTLSTSGAHTLGLSSTDLAGNVEPSQTVLVQMDLVAPGLTLVPPPAVAASAPAISGHATTGPSGGVVSVAVNGGAPLAATIVEGAWSLDLGALGLDEGLVTIVARAIDGAGRASAAVSASMLLDASPPHVALAGQDGHRNVATIALGFAFDDANPFREARVGWRFAPAGGEAGLWTDRGAVSPGSFVLPLTDGDGRYAIVVRGTDAGGRTSESAPLVVLLDRAAPTLARTSAARALVSDGVHTLAFDVADATSLASITLDVARDDGVVFSSASATLDVPLLPSTRALAYAIRATDAAGNVATLAGEVKVLDPAAPLPIVALEGPSGAGGWFVGDVVARLSASASDAAVRARAYPEGAPAGDLAPATAIAIRGTGRHVLEMQAFAHRHGFLAQSHVETRLVLVDLALPSVHVVAPSGTVPEGRRVPVVAEASDVGSGVARVAVVVERDGESVEAALQEDPDGRWRGDIGPFRLGERVHLRAIATDVAGLTSATPRVPIAVADASPPLVVITAPAPGRVSGVIEVLADAADEGGLASVAFEIDGEPHAGSTWDTASAQNGAHTIVARAKDLEGNEATDEIQVIVDNPPVLGDLLLSPSSDGEPTTLTPEIVASLAVPASRPVAADLFHRVGGGAFTKTTMSIEAGVASARIPGPFRADDLVEAFVVVADGASSSRAPPAGVASARVRLAPSAPLAAWIQDSATSFAATSSADIAEDYADIVDAAVLPGPEWVTFAATMEGPLDTTGHARYYVDLYASGDAPAPLLSYNVTSDGAGTWSVSIDQGGATRGTTSDTHRVLADTAEFRIRVRPAALVEDLGGIPLGLAIGFRTVGSGDATTLAPLDLVAPEIASVTPLDTARGSMLRVAVAASDAVSDVVVKVLASAPGAGILEAAVVEGVATLGVVSADRVDLLVVATDSSGNRAERTLAVTLRDVTAPVARPALAAGAGLDEDAPVMLVADASTDDVGIVSYAWDLDGDGAPETNGRRTSVTFDEPGLRSVGLTVRDAAGNSHSATLALTIVDRTAPAVTLLAPAEGALLKAGAVTIRSSAIGAQVAGFRIDGGPWQPMAASAGSGFVAVWGATEGSHTIDASATDAAGNRGVAPRPITIVVDGTPPTVELSAPASALVGEVVPITATVSDTNGIAAYAWTFQDGSVEACDASCAPAGQVAATRAFDRPGLQVITFTVHDRAGNAATRTVTIAIGAAPPPPPPASAPTHASPVAFPRAPITARIEGPSASIAGVSVAFEAARDGVGEPTYTWDFGDGAVASGRQVAHAWAETGVYVIRMHVADGERQGSALRLHVAHAAPSAAPEATAPAGDDALVDGEPLLAPGSRLPEARAIVPSGVLRSPATISFELDNAELVFWRLPGRADWDSSNPAVIAGEGTLTIDYYALNAAGRSTTRAVTLRLDAFPPVVRIVSAPEGLVAGVASEIRIAVEDVSDVVATAEIAPADGGAPTIVALVAKNGVLVANVPALAAGDHIVTIVARDAVGRETRETIGTWTAAAAAEEPIEGSSVPAAVIEPGADTPGPGILGALAAVAAAALVLRRRRP